MTSRTVEELTSLDGSVKLTPGSGVGSVDLSIEGTVIEVPSGLLADRPAAATLGRLYLATDATPDLFPPVETNPAAGFLFVDMGAGNGWLALFPANLNAEGAYQVLTPVEFLDIVQFANGMSYNGSAYAASGVISFNDTTSIATASDIELTTPATCFGNGQVFRFINDSAGTLTVTPNAAGGGGAQTINGSTESLLLTPRATATLLNIGGDGSPGHPLAFFILSSTPDLVPVVVGGALAVPLFLAQAGDVGIWGVDAANGAVWLNTSNAQNDLIERVVSCPPGVYDIHLTALANGAGANAHVLVDGVDVGNVDTYDGGGGGMIDAGINGVAISNFGPHVIKVKATDHNVLSAGYTLALADLTLTLT